MFRKLIFGMCVIVMLVEIVNKHNKVSQSREGRERESDTGRERERARETARREQVLQNACWQHLRGTDEVWRRQVS